MGGPAGRPVRVQARSGVFPCVYIEAVEGTDAGEEDGCGKQHGSKPGGAGDGGNEDGGGKEEADGEFFGKAASNAIGQRASMDEKHPSTEEGSEEDVEVERSSVDAVEEIDESEGAEGDDGKEVAAMAMVEAVTGFEIIFLVAGYPGEGVP